MTTMIHSSGAELSGELSGGDSQLFLRGVPTELVRRTHDSDVFLTSLRVTGPSCFDVGARWPGAHSFYGPPQPDMHDPLLFLETVRQAVLFIGQYAYGIPRASKFITHDKQFNIIPAGLRTNGTEPVDITMSVAVHDIRRRGKHIAGMRLAYACYRDGQPFGSAGYRVSLASDAVYARLRGKYLGVSQSWMCAAEPVAPELVGRHDEVDVMLAEAPDGRGWLLRIDPDHPVVFDHAIDHVPGNGAAEAARQAALLAIGQPDAITVRCDFSFAHYLEFDMPCVVRAEEIGEGADGSRSVRVVFEQDGRTSAEGTFDLLVRDPDQVPEAGDPAD